MFRNSTRLAAIGLAAASMLAVGATAASAGVTPSPSPTHTRPVPTPTPTQPVVNPLACNQRPITFAPTNGPTDEQTDGVLQPVARHDHTPPPVVNPQTRCRPENFNISLTVAGNSVITNYARFRGPVAGTGSDDLGVSTNTFDRFSLPGPGQRVNLLHTGAAFPSIDLNNCTAAVVQLGVWRFAGGPVFSVFRHAIGNGTFRLVGLWHFPSIRGQCSLRFIIGNPLLQNRVNPDFTVIGVRGQGVAAR